MIENENFLIQDFQTIAVMCIMIENFEIFLHNEGANNAISLLDSFFKEVDDLVL
jgi:hypothetical protein